MYMENLLNKISPTEQEEIRRYIMEYAVKSEEYVENFAPLETLLSNWNEAKNQYLAKMFEGQLILERKVEYDATPEELEYRLNKIYRPRYDKNEFFNSLYNLFWNNQLFSVLTRDYSETFSSTCSYLMDYKVLMMNRWEKPTTIFPLPNDRSFKVCPGTKITRILGRLAKEWELPNWEAVREAHALASTSKKTKGTLCLSIHPFDYMTMSDNEENWESCMNWREEGCYRAGTVEMMNSPMVVVVYLKSDETNLWNYSWNSKTWRELFIVNPSIITNIKAYPTQNSYATILAGNWLVELAEKAGINKYRHEAQIIAETPGLSNIHFRTRTMYNDCGCHAQYAHVHEQFKDNENLLVVYSGPRTCMTCGEVVDDERDASSLVCDNCDSSDAWYCECCGRRINENDRYWIEDSAYCYDCWEDLGAVPYEGDETRYYKDMVKVYIKLPDGESSYAMYVYDKEYFCERFGIEHLTYDEDEDVYYVPYDEADKNMMYECGIGTIDKIRYDNWDKSEVVRENIVSNFIKSQGIDIWA